MRERGLADVEQRHQLAHADLAGVLEEHVDELQADRVAERLGHRGHPRRLLALDIGINDRLIAALASGALGLRRQLKSTTIDLYIPIEVTNVNAYGRGAWRTPSSSACTTPGAPR